MVTVRINKDGFGYSRIEVTDHADPKVCAGVSALLWGLAGTLMDAGADFVELLLGDGHFIIDVTPQPDNPTLQAYFRFVDISLKQIKKSYPQDIDIEML